MRHHVMHVFRQHRWSVVADWVAAPQMSSSEPPAEPLPPGAVPEPLRRCEPRIRGATLLIRVVCDGATAAPLSQELFIALAPFAAALFSIIVETSEDQVGAAASEPRRKGAVLPETYAGAVHVVEGLVAAINAGVFPPTDPGSWICSAKFSGTGAMSGVREPTVVESANSLRTGRSLLAWPTSSLRTSPRACRCLQWSAHRTRSGGTHSP